MRTISRQTSIVQPKAKTPEHWVGFNYFDLTVNHSYVLVGFFYHLQLDGSEFEGATELLKSSLSETLTSFYPFAGRVFNREDHGGGGRQSALLCNDEGALFSVALVDARLRDVESFDLPPISGMPSELGPGPLYDPEPSGLPALVVQTSLFSCGGVAVAVSWHHQVADGYSAFHFIKSWGEVARGAGMSLAPIHNRSLLSPRDPPRITVPMDKYYDIGERQLSSTPGLGAGFRSFHFSKAALVELVNRASEGRAKKFTRAESLAGHIWRNVAMWRGLQSEDRIHFMSIVDGRSRFCNPSLGAGYFGNVICIARASSTVGELLQQPLSHTASLVHEAFVGVTDDYLRSLMDWIKIRGAKNVFQGRDRVIGRDLRVVFWTHFPMQEIDFKWGKPDQTAVGSTFGPRWEGTVLVLPGPRDSPGSMVAQACLDESVLARLFNDPAFIPC